MPTNHFFHKFFSQHDRFLALGGSQKLDMFYGCCYFNFITFYGVVVCHCIEEKVMDSL